MMITYFLIQHESNINSIAVKMPFSQYSYFGWIFIQFVMHKRLKPFGKDDFDSAHQNKRLFLIYRLFTVIL